MKAVHLFYEEDNFKAINFNLDEFDKSRVDIGQTTLTR